MKRFLVCILISVFFVLTISETAFADIPRQIYGAHGSAKFIGGNTVVVSIFADDAYTHWSWPLSGADKELYDRIHYQMGIGLDWLEYQASRYGVISDFSWDYDDPNNEYPLSYAASFSSDLTNYTKDGFLEVCRYVTQNLYPNEIMKYYNADNLIIAVHLNAPNSQNYRSYAHCANNFYLSDDEFMYEMVFFTPYGNNRYNTPAVYAHEILHCFGAADLYYANEFIPQSYVDYLDGQGHRDLMNSCFFSDMNSVTCEFSEVDAWLVGLTDYCEAANYFPLGTTIWQRWGYVR